MASKKDLEKRIESLEKEVQHIKAALQYQTRNQKKSNGSWLVELTASCIIWYWLKLDI